MILLPMPPYRGKLSNQTVRIKLAAVLALCGLATASASRAMAEDQASAPIGAMEARKIAAEAYTFAYPLVLAETTRRANTQNGSPRLVNHFLHVLAFPDDRFRQVIRPNADTLYSSSWLDLSQEPMLLHVPDTKGRYYLMQFMDAWTETIASPGKRTTGNCWDHRPNGVVSSGAR